MFKKLLPPKSASRWLANGETRLEVDKHFTIIKKLGRGAYATVYQVRRHEDSQLYALKVADVHTLGPLEQGDAVNEIRLLASLSHPNLTTFYEAFCDHGKLCIVQELVGGGDVSTLIKRRAASSMHFSEEQVWATFLQAALGLQYLHHNKIMHRDLKPANLLVSESGLLKVADLGIAQLMDRVFEKTLIGTPHYMAPEMWRRQPYSYSADVWALGCILHELCTLRPLFLAGSDAEVREKVLAGVIPPLPARYSAELRALVAAILCPDPKQRPTIDEVLYLPACQRHLSLLPPELQRRCISPALSGEQDLARLVRPIQVPQGPDDWELLNELMPTPRYPSGSSVAGALRKKKSWKSTGDLQALAAAAAAEEEGGKAGPSAGHSRQGSVTGQGKGGLGLARPPPPPAAEAAAAMRKSSSHGSLASAGGLAAAVEQHIERSSSSLTRRKSLSVGELLRENQLHLENFPRASAAGGGAGSGPLNLPAVPRRKSMSLLPAVAEEPSSGSTTMPPASALGGAAGPAGAGPAPAPAPASKPPPVAAGGSAGSPAGAVPAVVTPEAQYPGPRSLAVGRSRSLSVEDAIEVLARSPPLALPPRKAAAASPLAASPLAAAAGEVLPQQPGLQAAQPAAAAAINGGHLSPAGPAGAGSAVPQPQPGMPGASVTAQVQVQPGSGAPGTIPAHTAAGGGGSLKQAPTAGPEAAPASGAEGKGKKKVGFFKALRGHK